MELPLKKAILNLDLFNQFVRRKQDLKEISQVLSTFDENITLKQAEKRVERVKELGKEVDAINEDTKMLISLLDDNAKIRTRVNLAS